MDTSADVLLVHCAVVDAHTGQVSPDQAIRIVDGRIREIGPSASVTSPESATRVDVGNRVVMPGLIDAHVHVMASTLQLSKLPRQSATLLTAKAAAIMKDMLMRGFTSVRDAGGADWGLKEAVRTAYFPGPRLFIAGRGIAQTGGQGDFRDLEETDLPDYCTHRLGPMARVADGTDAVQAAVREEIRRGADQIKVFAGGGIVSGISLEQSHMTVDELRMASDEAKAAGTYVMAHAYGPESILRAVDAGVRTIEHGNLVTDEVARKIADRAYLVPTLSALEGRLRHADELGYAPAVCDTMRRVIAEGLRGIESCMRAGLPVGFGTDLEGIIHPYQLLEFRIRSEVQSSVDLLRSATVVNAEILNRSGELGVVAEGALADLLVVSGNPWDDYSILEQPGRVNAIIKEGVFVHNQL